jgi:hypothetical protein
VLEVPIDRQEYVEVAFGEVQQLAVSLAAPSHFRSRRRVVAGELAFEPSEGISKAQAIAALEQAKEALLALARPA